MTTTAVLIAAVAAAGAVGAALRSELGLRFTAEWPVGTLMANVAASFLLGLLADLDGRWGPVLTIGFLGALSTWSSLALDVVELAAANRRRSAFAYLTCSVLTGVGAAWLGLAA